MRMILAFLFSLAFCIVVAVFSAKGLTYFYDTYQPEQRILVIVVFLYVFVILPIIAVIALAILGLGCKDEKPHKVGE